MRSARTVLVAAIVLACSDEPDAPLPLPAPVAAAVEDACGECHGAEPAFGAPMPIVSWDDTQRPAPTMPELAVWESMRERIRDARLPMPPRGTGALTDAQRDALEAWFEAGAPPGT